MHNILEEKSTILDHNPLNYFCSILYQLIFKMSANFFLIESYGKVVEACVSYTTAAGM